MHFFCGPSGGVHWRKVLMHGANFLVWGLRLNVTQAWTSKPNGYLRLIYRALIIRIGLWGPLYYNHNKELAELWALYAGFKVFQQMSHVPSRSLSLSLSLALSLSLSLCLCLALSPAVATEIGNKVSRLRKERF